MLVYLFANCIRADQRPVSNGSALPSFPTGWHPSVKNKIYSIGKTHKNRDGLNFLLDFTMFRVYFDTNFNLIIVSECLPGAGTETEMESVVCTKKEIDSC